MQYSNSRSSQTAVPLSHRFAFTSSHRWMPMIARGVLVSWLLPLMVAMLTTLALTANPASAQTQQQIETQGVITERAIVIDFSVAPGIDPVLGRKAADALAVELQRSGEFEVVPRQRVEQALAENSALTPPFNAFAQTRLAQILGARSAFSGRVVSVESGDRKQARVQLDVRQVDVVSNDYIGGAQVSEVSVSTLQQTDPEVLRDQAVNRAAAVAVRIMKQTRFPIGTVLNTAFDNIVINLGATSGVAPGQRYAVLRDIYDRGRNVTERIRIGELTVKRVEAELSDASISGGSGVRTGDKVRQIYVPSNYPVSTSADGGTRLPSAASGGRKGSGSNVIKKAGSGLGGILGLVGLVALAGFAGGSSGSRADRSEPTNVRATPVTIAGGQPGITVNYSTGLPGILAGENVVGFLVYRDDFPDFTPNPGNLQEFVEGGTTSFVDRYSLSINTRTVNIEVEDDDTGGGNGGGDDGGTGGGGNIPPTIENTTTIGAPEDGNTFSQTQQSIEAEFAQSPPIPGFQYFYKVRRITTVRIEESGGDDDGNGGNDGGTGGTGGTTTTRRLAISNPSAPSGGATSILPPIVNSTSGNLDNFRVTIGSTVIIPVPLRGEDEEEGDDNFILINVFPYSDVDEFVVQVSSSSAGFSEASTFTQIVPNPNTTGQTLNLVLGDIRVPNFEPGDNVVVRVGARNSTDSPGPLQSANSPVGAVFGPSFTITQPTGRAIASRFLPSGDNRRVGGVGLPGSSAVIRRKDGTIRGPGRIIR